LAPRIFSIFASAPLNYDNAIVDFRCKISERLVTYRSSEAFQRGLGASKGLRCYVK
jgi:hypothetical protein